MLLHVVESGFVKKLSKIAVDVSYNFYYNYYNVSIAFLIIILLYTLDPSFFKRLSSQKSLKRQNVKKEEKQTNKMEKSRELIFNKIAKNVQNWLIIYTFLM